MHEYENHILVTICKIQTHINNINKHGHISKYIYIYTYVYRERDHNITYIQTYIGVCMHVCMSETRACKV